MFSISYAIKPDQRERYIGLIREMKQQMAGAGTAEYAVFETKGRKNHFTEVFTTASVDAFDALEDNQDERTQELVSRIEECVDDGGMKYSTLLEAEI
jgi:hypothetical protein